MPGYVQLTLSQLQALFYEGVGGNRAFFRADEATRILQESFRVFNCLTGFWREPVTAGTTVAAQHFYAVPAGQNFVLRVLLNGVALQNSSLYDLDYGREAWESEVCTSTTLPQAWAPAGLRQFAIWPASFAGGESLVCECVIAAPVLTAVSFVNLGQDALECILDYATHIAQFKEGGQEFQASEVLLKQFLKAAAERNGVLKQSSKFRSWLGLSSEKKRPMRQPDAQIGAR